MKELDARFGEWCGVTSYEFLGDELRVDIPVEEGDTITAGDMEFRIIYLPGHTRCCVGYYCEKEGLLLSAETLGVYDGKETIVPSYLVGYEDTISSIEKVEMLNIKVILAPHYGLLDERQTEFFLKNMKSEAGNNARDILDSLKKGYSDEEILKNYKQKYWCGYIKEIYPEDAVNLNTSIMIRLIKNELMKNHKNFK
jgi:glyoxylase-like metal-dependent hydrolase (beta-lactamase superfamily II)